MQQYGGRQSALGVTRLARVAESRRMAGGRGAGAAVDEQRTRRRCFVLLKRSGRADRGGGGDGGRAVPLPLSVSLSFFRRVSLAFFVPGGAAGRGWPRRAARGRVLDGGQRRRTGTAAAAAEKPAGVGARPLENDGWRRALRVSGLAWSRVGGVVG